MTRKLASVPPLAAAFALASLMLPSVAFANSDGLPHVTGTGVTKPPGAPLPGEAGELAAHHERGRVLSDRLRRSICDGC